MKHSWTLSRQTFLKAGGSAALLLSTGASLSCRNSRQKPLRVGLVSDTHYADRAPANNRYYRESISKFQECVDRMNEEQALEDGDWVRATVEMRIPNPKRPAPWDTSANWNRCTNNTKGLATTYLEIMTWTASARNNF